MMKKYLLPEKGNFYKANLHSHSTVSDGRLSPEEMKELYKSLGYSVIAYTDHDVLIPHHDLTDDTFLALSGFEVAFNENSTYPGNKFLKTCHLCFIAKSPDIDVQPCWNERYAYIGNAGDYISKVKKNENEAPYVREYTPGCINEMIMRGREAGFFVTYNHPSWSLENYEQYSKYEGLCAMEILNYSCEISGFPAYQINEYDDMLRLGKKIFAVAADDNHNVLPPSDPKCDSGGGFVMIKAEMLEYETITDALFKGDFYASAGPEIYDLYIEENKIYVKCSDASMIVLNKGCRGAISTVASDENETLNEAVFDFKDDDIYLRITVKDKKGRMANTRAYFLDDIIK